MIYENIHAKYSMPPGICQPWVTMTSAKSGEQIPRYLTLRFGFIPEQFYCLLEKFDQIGFLIH